MKLGRETQHPSRSEAALWTLDGLEMPPPDYWPDAKRIPADKLGTVVEAVRAVRDAQGLSNADLWREVRKLVERHNAVPDRQKVHPQVIAEPGDPGKRGKYELSAIQKGTRKYLVGYLAWLCLRDEAAARALYEEVGLTFRPYREDDDPRAEGTSAITTWARVIDDHASYGNVMVVSLQQESLRLVDFLKHEPVSRRALKLGEPFCFRLDAPHPGYVIAFQRYRRLWYPMPLAAEALHDRIEAGPQALPRDPVTRAPVALCESVDAGEYGFGFLVADDDKLVELAVAFQLGATLPESLAASALRLLGALPERSRAIHRVNVVIKA